ncbi:MAG TPA: M23 family metallopeptidase [Kofleriaceae bacterium]|nr:M23 family metallopeptidase [Kofleriaceae bacterium]
MVRRRTSPRKKRTVYPALGAQPAKKSGAWVILILGALVVVNLYVFVWDKKTGVAAIRREANGLGTGSGTSLSIPAAPLAPNPNAATGRATDGGAAPAPVGPPGTIEGKVGKADTLGRLLKKSGLSAAEADEVIRALSGVLDFKTIRAGQPFRIERGPDGRVKLFELEISKIQKIRAERQPTGELTGTADNKETRIELKSVGGKIDSSLYAAIKASGETAALVDFFADVFAYDIDFYNDTQEGDTFRIVVEKKLSKNGEADEHVGYGRILAAEYKGKVGTFQTYFWNGKYYDATGQSSERGMLKTPLKFARMSSGFDRKRMHPILHTVRAHLGVDYAAPVGTPVWAAAAGIVTQCAPAGGAGNLVMIRHDSGIETAYMHLSKFASIKVGQRIEAKTVIGYVGTTGLSTGPHLHFGVKKNGEFIDPSKLTPWRGRPVTPRDLDAFKTEAAKLDAMMSSATIGLADARLPRHA